MFSKILNVILAGAFALIAFFIGAGAGARRAVKTVKSNNLIDSKMRDKKRWLKEGGDEAVVDFLKNGGKK
jgi:hypothetical protein